MEKAELGTNILCFSQPPSVLPLQWEVCAEQLSAKTLVLKILFPSSSLSIHEQNPKVSSPFWCENSSESCVKGDLGL